VSTRLWIGDMPRPEDANLGLDSNGNPVYTDGESVKVMVELTPLVRDIIFSPESPDLGTDDNP